MLTKAQATAMFNLQADMNTKIDPDWVNARYPYLRAVIVEAAEAIEHHGWKWWKRQEKDIPQLQMEIIDIWHFLLSEMLLRNNSHQAQSVDQLLSNLSNVDSLKTVLYDGAEIELKALNLLELLELLIGLSAAKRVEIGVFSAIMSAADLDWAGVFTQYVGKNVLNIFRQDHGYKEGTYNKLWSGREDNEHLVDVLDLLNPADEDYQDKLYSHLEARYS